MNPPQVFHFLHSVSDKNTAVSLIEHFLNVISHFSLSEFCLSLDSLANICQDVDLFEFVIFEYFEPLDVDVNVFNQVWKFLTIISSHILSSHFCFSFSSETPVMHILAQLMVSPHVYEAMFIFPYSFNFSSSN